MQIKTETVFNPAHQKLYQDILRLTLPVRESYPDYCVWYKNTFLEGLRRGERMILMAREKGELLGVALLKKTQQEKKLCTLFVRPESRRQGVGQQLLLQTIQELRQNPLVSVSEKNRAKFSSLFNRFGFRLSARKKGIYLPQDTEYYFNDEKAETIQNGLIPVLMARMKQLKRD